MSKGSHSYRAEKRRKELKRQEKKKKKLEKKLEKSKSQEMENPEPMETQDQGNE